MAKVRALAVSVAVLLLAGCSALFWWNMRWQDCGELLRDAAQAMAQGDLARAESLYNHAISLRAAPAQKVLAYAGRAAIELGRNRNDEAIGDYTRALDIDKAMLGMHAGRALAWQRKGEYTRALQDYEAALRQNPNDAFVFNNRYLIFVARSDWPNALADLDEAIRCWPENAAAFVSRGAIYEQLRNYDAAFVDYDIALRLYPFLSQAYNHRGAIFRRRGQTERARADEEAAAACTKLAMSTAPGFSPSTISAGTAGYLYRAGDTAQLAGAQEQARLLYSAALMSPDLTPDARAYVQLMRSLAEMDLGDWQAAAIDLNESIALNRHFDGAYIDRANIALHFGRYDEAITDCNTAATLNSARAETYINRAEAYAGKYNPGLALADLGKAAELNPGSTDVYLRRALLLIDQRHPVEALADLERCAKLKPDLPSIYFEQGHALAALAKFAEATAAYERGLALRPEPGSDTLNQIAWLLATCPDAKFRQPQRAVSFASRACDMTQWRSASLRDTLAAACAAMGDFRGAVANERTALALDRAHNRGPMEQRLKLFEQEQPYLANNYSPE